MLFHKNDRMPEEDLSVRTAIRGYTSLERYPGDLTPRELASTRVHPNKDLLVDYEDWHANIIVTTVASLVSALFKGQSGYGGVQYVAVGSGLATWDNDMTPAATIGQTELENELGRVDVTSTSPPSIVFLDATNTATSTVTNRIQVSGTFAPADAVGTWREWGVFGGTATASADSGILIDYLTHGAKIKANDETLIRRVRFVF